MLIDALSFWIDGQGHDWVGISAPNQGTQCSSATVSETAAVLPRFPINTNGDHQMDLRDQELLDKQMRRLTPPRNDGVIAVLLAAMFLVGMTLGSVLSEPKTEPIQIASME
jgi:hypothetical protein